MRFTGFIGPSYTLSSVNIDCQRCINLYPEMNELGTGKEGEVAALLGTPGLSLLADLGVGPIRGIHATKQGGRLFVVSANKLYELDATFTATEIGTLNSATGYVSMDDNGLQLVIVDGADGYYVTLATNAFLEITDPDWMGANQVTYQDGYFIFNRPDTGQFYISDLSSIAIDALDIASAEGSPDNIVGIISDHQDLWIFGQNSVEVFFNSGAAAFPFERTQGAFVEHGCAARFSIAKMNNAVFWLSSDDKGQGMVYMASSYQPQRISTHAVEFAIQNYATISDAIAWTYQQNGHHFYVLNFPSAATTWVYDSSTGMWHERAYTVAGEFQRHRAHVHSFAFGKHVVGDYENGNIYELSSTVYTDAGAEIVRRRVSPHITSGLKRIFYDTFQLDVETGTGLDGIAQGTDPQAFLEFSDDGGHTWSNEKWLAFGKIGQRKKRAIWRRLGQSRDRVFRVTISDPVKVVVLGAELTLRNGSS